mgnify:CR=1 FL=1
MATFTSGYQIKLIADGGESGTWGQSTNENLERIEQALGESVLINVEYGSENSTWDVDTHTLTWLTNNSGDAADTGGNGKGRARYVEFISTLQFNVPVTVNIRGNTDLIYPDRVYLVKNSINTNAPPANDSSDLRLNVGGPGYYTVRPGAFALVVANASTAITGTTRDAGSVFNALSDLQIENLIFGNAADITLRDNLATALEIKSTVANTEFLRFDTVHNHLEIAPGSAINNIELISDTITTSAQATALRINTSDVAALDIRSNTSSLLKLDTSADKTSIGQANLDMLTDTITMTSSTGVDLHLESSVTNSLRLHDNVTPIINLDTALNKVSFLANECDIDIETGNTLLVRSGATLNVDGLSQLGIVAIDGGSVDAGSIKNTSIGVGTGASAVRGSRFTQDAAAYSSTFNGFTFGDTTTPSGLLRPSVASVVKLRQLDGKPLGFIKSSEMDHATDGSTGYFTDDWIMPSTNSPVHWFWSILFSHGFSDTPKTVNWYWERVTAPDPLDAYDYPVGARVSVYQVPFVETQGLITDIPPLVTMWKNSSKVGLNMRMNRFISGSYRNVWKIALNSDDYDAVGEFLIINSPLTSPANRDWKLVVEAWE